jgi:hypothetical protein
MVEEEMEGGRLDNGVTGEKFKNYLSFHTLQD